jgi:transcriptional regulator with XRE-family HTH domain
MGGDLMVQEQSSGKRAAAASSFGEALAAVRKERGLTQEQLAERARLSTRAISDLERGLHRAPRASTFALLAQALELGEQEIARLASRIVRHRVRRRPPLWAPIVTVMKSIGGRFVKYLAHARLIIRMRIIP